jgi:hypothetical protein
MRGCSSDILVNQSAPLALHRLWRRDMFGLAQTVSERKRSVLHQALMVTGNANGIAMELHSHTEARID